MLHVDIASQIGEGFYGNMGACSLHDFAATGRAVDETDRME